MLAIILLFTPTLGIFDTMHHAKMGSMSVIKGNRTFDYSENGSPISFEKAWGQFKLNDSTKFFSMPIFLVVCVLLCIFLFHTIASALLHKLARAMSENSGLKPGLSFKYAMEGLQTFLTPPLHLDWEEFFISSNCKLPIRSCWKRYSLNLDAIKSDSFLKLCSLGQGKYFWCMCF